MFQPMQQRKIEVQPMEMAALLNKMAQGHLQMPRFQREFVWPLTKTRALLDSMYKEFPIGTLFFWQAPSDQTDIFRELQELGIPKPPPNFPVSFILDGQQRLTSLYAVVHGLKLGSQDYRRVCLDLEKAARYEQARGDEFDEDIFVARQPDNRRWIAFRDLLGPDNYTIYDNIPSEWKAVFQKARSRFITYPFSVVWVYEQPLNEVVEIFQRINQGGKRLSSYDLVCANLWTPEFNFRQKVTQLNKELDNSGFGKIEENIVTQAVALILRGRTNQSIQLRLKTAEVQAIWDDVAQAILRAINFAEANLGVKRFEFFPYRGLLSILTYFFYKAPHSTLSAEHRRILWQWFWSVSLSERYSANTQARITEDATAFRKLLNGEKVPFTYASKATAESISRVRMTSQTSALRNAILCLLALHHPRNFKDGSPVNLTDNFFNSFTKAERHHIFPTPFLRKSKIYTRDVHLVANFAFLPSDLNKEISTKAPSEYLSQCRDENPTFDQDVQTHLIPVSSDSPIWQDDYREFIRERAKVIADALNKFLESGPVITNIPSHFKYEGREVEIIKSLEFQLRTLIDDRLRTVAGDGYWNSAIPEKVAEQIEYKIREELNDFPYRDRRQYLEPRKKLDYCGVANYAQIIKHNWPVFQPVFGIQDNFIQHMNAFRKFRNPIAHHNHETVDDVQKKLMEAATLWIQQCIDSYENEQEEVIEEMD